MNKGWLIYYGDVYGELTEAYMFLDGQKHQKCICLYAMKKCI